MYLLLNQYDESADPDTADHPIHSLDACCWKNQHCTEDNGTGISCQDSKPHAWIVNGDQIYR